MNSQSHRESTDSDMIGFSVKPHRMFKERAVGWSLSSAKCASDITDLSAESHGTFKDCQALSGIPRDVWHYSVFFRSFHDFSLFFMIFHDFFMIFHDFS